MIRRASIERLERRALFTVLAGGFAEQTLASGLDRPTVMEFAPDGRLFVAEQGGDVRLIKDGSLVPTPVLSVVTDSNVERGLVGLVLDPNFSSNKQFYVYYTATTPTVHNRISRYTLNGDVVDAGSRVDIVDLPTLSGAQNHNGGAMHFGPDGKLYVAVGENGNPPQAQDLSNPFGKILRLNKDGSIPTDNPFYNTTTGIARGIWAYGLRNAFTFAFQPGTGLLFANDVGQSTWEEVDEIKRGGNYGWPIHEGPTGGPGFERPTIWFPHGEDGSDPPTAIVGGTFYDTSADVDNPFPASYDSTYFYAEAVRGYVKMVHVDEDGSVDRPVKFADDIPYPVDLDVGPDGSLYVLSRVNGYSEAREPARVLRYTFTGSARPSIGLDPQSRTVGLGEKVTFNVQASGSGLKYQWQRNGTNIAGATGKSYTVENPAAADDGAQFRVVVSNGSGSITSSAAKLTVINDTPPVPTITIPADGFHFVAGQPISFAGSATDVEDGTIDPATFSWNISYFTGGLDRPFLPDTIQAGGSFTPATVSPYLLTDQFYRVRLTVTDSDGLSVTTSVDVQPTVTTIKMDTNVPGLQLALDGTPVNAPFSTEAVAGMDRPVSAPATQEVNGVVYDFVGWSDGGTIAHTYSTPVVPATLVATYQPRVATPTPTPTATELEPTLVKYTTGKRGAVVAGTKGSAQVRIANRGSVGYTGPVQLSLFLSADGVLDDNDLPAAELAKTLKLKVGAHPVVKTSFVYPEVDKDGDFYLLARVVPAVGGGDAIGNISPSPTPVRVEHAAVDLKGGAVTHKPGLTVPAGGKASLTLHAINDGNLTAAGVLSYAVYARRVDAASPDAEPVLLANGLKAVNIRAGGAAKIAVQFVLPEGVTAGTYELTAVLDPDGSFIDRDPTNNIASAALPLSVL